MVQRLKELLFQEHEILRKTVVKNALWLSIGQIGSRLIRAVIIIYAARLLGAAEYGVFSYALGLAGFFTVFGDIGITSILTREAARHPTERSFYFATSFWMKMALLIATALIIVFIVPLFARIEAAKIIIPFAALLVIFDGARDLVIAFVRAKDRMDIEALITIITNVAITAIGFLILSSSATAKALTISYVASAGTGTLAAFLILKKETARVIQNFRRELITSIMKSALPIALLSVFGVFMMNIDIIMLGWFRSAEEIGFYSAGLRIVQILYILPAIVATSMFPSLSKLVSEGYQERAVRLIEKATTSVLLIAFPIIVGGIILGAPLIELVFGAAYSPGVIPFKILIAVVALVFIGNIMGNALLAYDLQKKMGKFIVVAAVMNIALNYFLIPIYGILGAAVATLLSQTFHNSAMWFIIKKRTGFVTVPYLAKIIGASFIMGIVAYLLNQFDIPVVANVMGSAAVYFAILWFAKETIIGELRSVVIPIKQ